MLNQSVQAHGAVQCPACQATNIGAQKNCLLCATPLIRQAAAVPEAATALHKSPDICLLALSGEYAGQRFPLGEFTRIGRSLENSITLSDAQVSRKHAAIQRIGSLYVLLDHGSANGTYINEKRVSDRSHIKPGDVIRIGNTRLRVELI